MNEIAIIADRSFETDLCRERTTARIFESTLQAFSDGRHAKKLRMVLVIGLVAVAMAIQPTHCRAQAEIDPDHYDTVDSGPLPQAKPTIAIGQKVGSFRGKFTLPFDVDYARLTLPSGSYSLSVRSVGKEHIVTLIPKGNRVRIQAIRVRVRTASNVGGASALVLERTAERRSLSATRLTEAGVTLELRDEKAPNISTVTERAPISFKGRSRRKS
jgi:hypothetical protein